MKKERKWLCGILAAVILGNMTGCAEQISGKTTVNRILAEESYINVILGEGYHQQEVRFDLKNDRAGQSRSGSSPYPEAGFSNN